MALNRSVSLQTRLLIYYSVEEGDVFLSGTTNYPEALFLILRLLSKRHTTIFAPGTLWHPTLYHTLHIVTEEWITTQI